MTFYDDFWDIFDDPEKAITSEAKAKDNKEDELLKLVDKSIQNIKIHDDTPNSSNSPTDYIKGKNLENYDSHSIEKILVQF